MSTPNDGSTDDDSETRIDVAAEAVFEDWGSSEALTGGGQVRGQETGHE